MSDFALNNTRVSLTQGQNTNRKDEFAGM